MIDRIALAESKLPLEEMAPFLADESKKANEYAKEALVKINKKGFIDNLKTWRIGNRMLKCKY